MAYDSIENYTRPTKILIRFWGCRRYSMATQKHARGKEVAAAAKNKSFREVPPSNINIQKEIEGEAVHLQGMYQQSERKGRSLCHAWCKKKHAVTKAVSTKPTREGFAVRMEIKRISAPSRDVPTLSRREEFVSHMVQRRNDEADDVTTKPKREEFVPPTVQRDMSTFAITRDVQSKW